MEIRFKNSKGEYLPKEINDIVNIRFSEQGRFGEGEESLISAIIWIRTIEGGSFWNQIDLGNYEPFYKLYPKLESEVGNFKTPIIPDLEAFD